MAATLPLTGLHDIFYHILSHLTPDPKAGAPWFGSRELHESISARKALCCLARTHSSFTQPALDKMWCSLPSPKPLEHLLCVVGIARRPPPGEWSGPPLELCGTPATHGSGWARFQEYASRVRNIIVVPLYGPQDFNAELLRDTFWCRLLSACGDTPILPHLEGVTITRRTSKPRAIDTGVLRLVNMSSVRDFHVASSQSSREELEQLGKALSVFFLSMPHLEVLTMEVWDMAPFLSMELLPIFHPRLRCVKLHRSPSIELGSLPLLANIPDLQDLSIHLHLRGPEPPNLRMEFPQLRILLITCGEPVVVGVLLDRVNAPQLRTFTVFEMHKDSHNLSHTLPRYLDTLVTKFPSLTRFRWVSKQSCVPRIGYFGERQVGSPLTQIVAPLLSHRAMRHFSMSFEGPTVLYLPHNFCTMAKAWPDLETVSLSDECQDEHYSWAERYADLESIAAFIRHCPRLRSIHLPMVLFDSSSAFSSEWARRVGPPLPQRRLPRELCVDRVVCSVAENVEDCSREEVGLFRGLMDMVFESVTVRLCMTSV